MSRRSRCSATDAESPDISAMLQLQTGQTTGLPVAGIAAESALAAVQALDALAVASAPLFTTGWSTLEEIRKTRDKVAAVYTAAGGQPEEAPHAAQRYVFV